MGIDDALSALLTAHVSPLADEVRLLRAAVTELTRDAASPALEPLASILGCSSAAARMRMNRDAELAQLAVVVGRRRLFRRREVLSLFEARSVHAARPSRLQLVVREQS